MKTKTPTLNVLPRFSLRLAPALVVAALIACGPLPTRANTIVFNTLGPGDTYNMSAGYNVEDASAGGLLETAAQFNAGVSGFLATVDLGLTFITAGPVDAFLYGDLAGSPNNASQTFLGSGTPTAAFGSTNNSIVSITVGGNVPVTLGSLYWLVLKPANSNMNNTWMDSSPVTTGAVKQSSDDSTWGNHPAFTLPAFRITARGAVSVPESGSTWTLLLLGVTATFGLTFFVRRSA